MEGILVAKIASLCIVLVISIVFGNIPYFVLKRPQTSTGARRKILFISIFNAFSGGVFLGTCLLHLMVEGREELEGAFTLYKVDIGYPLFEVIVAFGFFTITFVDFVAQLCFRASNNSIVLEKNKPKQPIVNGQTSRQNSPGRNPQLVKYEKYGTLKQKETNVDDTENNNSPERSSPEVVLTPPALSDDTSNAVVVSDHDHHHNHSNLDQHSNNHLHDEEYGHAVHDFNNLAKSSTIRAMLLLVALSFHTVFDGLAIGLQDMETDVWQVLAAIGVHKALVAFSLGHQLYQAYKERNKMAVALVQLFCLMSPIGITLGIIVTSSYVNIAAQTMASAVLQGIASGTFLYVTFFEILSTAFSHGQSIWNIFVAAIGFGAMAAVKLLDSD